MFRDLRQLPRAIRAYLQSLQPRHPFVVPDDELEMLLEEAKRFRRPRVHDSEDSDQNADDHSDQDGNASKIPFLSDRTHMSARSDDLARTVG